MKNLLNSFTFLPNVERLEISKCGLEYLFTTKNVLENCKKLHYINISENKISGKYFEAFINCLIYSKLEIDTLDISNLANDLILPILSNLENYADSGFDLIDLRMNNYPFSSIHIEKMLHVFPKFNLKCLHLSSCPFIELVNITQILKFSCYRLPFLQQLVLDNCNYKSHYSRDFIIALVSKLQSTVPLNQFVFSSQYIPCNDVYIIKKEWEKIWNIRSRFKEGRTFTYYFYNSQ
ncbi:hypothetical protein A3Q56_04478 [Intoshia linei]|uniref:Uncharacterized protein n=1 Tax=Intoshia linei TaxID=1819745 RepID=A0A177B0H1_9BILA|nr:hypothetical protein A3Q56_04478 [Intoshia linei]